MQDFTRRGRACQGKPQLQILFCIPRILQAVFLPVLFPQMTSRGSPLFNSSLLISSQTNPTWPQSHPSLTFPHHFSHAFLSPPLPGLNWVIRLCACPLLSLPCAPSEVMGSGPGRARVRFVVCSQALLWLEQEITSVLLPTFPPALLESQGFANPASYPAVSELQQPTRRKAAQL